VKGGGSFLQHHLQEQPVKASGKTIKINSQYFNALFIFSSLLFYAEMCLRDVPTFLNICAHVKVLMHSIAKKQYFVIEG
jgi:hypothetical protein